MVIAVLGFTLVLVPGHARADVNDFTITAFTADYWLDNKDPQGSLRVKEEINVLFTDNNHGILRALPKSYNGQNLRTKFEKVTRPDGSTWPYTTYTENDNVVGKIGDPNQTVTGAQTFIVEYTMQNVVTFYGDRDELYWDVNGDQWQQPFENVTARFHMPDNLSVTDAICFSGAFGTNTQQCDVNRMDNTVFMTTTQRLDSYETLSGVIGFQKGYFTAPTFTDWVKDHALWLAGGLGLPLLIGSWAFRRWYRDGRDLKGRGVIIPEYSPPHNMSAAEAGALMDYKVDTKDISATIIDLAIRKYLRIVETKEKKLIRTATTYQFELLNPDFSTLKPYEQKVLQAIFPSQQVGEVTDLSALKNKFYKEAQSIQKSIPEGLVTNGYLPRTASKATGSMMIFAAVLIGAAFFVRGPVGLGLAISGVIVGVFALLMPKRTATGVAAREQLLGLKLYLETAERDRIKMLQSPQAPFAPSRHAPKRTVELFEKLLPFAIIFGVEKQWAAQFKDIYTQPPDWYSGNWRTFNSVYLVSSLNSSVQAMGTGFSPPRSSSGSGLSGGGFSGGGGGGGGGGGW